MSVHDSTDDEFGRRLAIALHEAVPMPPAELLADLDSDSVRPLRTPVLRRVAPLLAAAAVIVLGVVIAILASSHKGGRTAPATHDTSSGSTVSCVLDGATITDRTASAGHLRVIIRAAITGTKPCLLPARPTVDFVAGTRLPFLPPRTDAAGADAVLRTSAPAAEFTLDLATTCSDPQHLASLAAGTQYGGVSPVTLSSTICSADVSAYRPVR